MKKQMMFESQGLLRSEQIDPGRKHARTICYIITHGKAQATWKLLSSHIYLNSMPGNNFIRFQSAWQATTFQKLRWKELVHEW